MSNLPRLNQSASAAYVGNTEGAIRKVIAKGTLPYTLDVDGTTKLIDPEDLDAHSWKAKVPTEAKRRAILEKAAKREAERKQERDTPDFERPAAHALTTSGHSYAPARRRTRAEKRAAVEESNRVTADDFKHLHYTERGAVNAMGVDRSEFRRLVRLEVVTEVVPPRAEELNVDDVEHLSAYPIQSLGIERWYSKGEVDRRRAERDARKELLHATGAHPSTVVPPDALQELIARFFPGLSPAAHAASPMSAEAQAHFTAPSMAALSNPCVPGTLTGPPPGSLPPEIQMQLLQASHERTMKFWDGVNRRAAERNKVRGEPGPSGPKRPCSECQSPIPAGKCRCPSERCGAWNFDAPTDEAERGVGPLNGTG